MKHEELESLPSKLAGDFRSIEPHLGDLDKHLTLRSYVEGYGLTDLDKQVWQTLKANKAALGFIRRNGLPNVTRWFTFVEQAHPELQEDKGGEAKKGGAANYNLALQDTEKGVVTRFLPEPSYVWPPSPARARRLLLTLTVATSTLATPRRPFSATTLATLRTRARCACVSTTPTRPRRAKSFRMPLSRTSR